MPNPRVLRRPDDVYPTLARPVAVRVARLGRPRPLVALAVLLPLVAACGAAHAEDGRAPGPSDADAVAALPPVLVQVVRAERLERAGEVRASGVVEPRASAELAFQVGGRVARVAVDEGDAVPRGAVLAALDPTDLALGLRQAELQAERAADERRRARALLDGGSIAPVEYERLDSGARQAAVARDLAAKRHADATLAAPFAGVVAARRVEVGATVAPGTPSFTLVDLAEVRVRVGVPEGEVGALRAGQPAQVTLPALGRTVAGRVRLVGVAADPASRTYPVEVTVPNGSQALRAGMVATVAVQAGARRTVVAVPAAAIARDAEGATQVWQHDEASGRVRARRVTVGAPLDGGLVEVSAGLAGGEPVVVGAQQRVREGARVTVAGASARTPAAEPGRAP